MFIHYKLTWTAYFKGEEIKNCIEEAWSGKFLFIQLWPLTIFPLIKEQFTKAHPHWVFLIVLIKMLITHYSERVDNIDLKYLLGTLCADHPQPHKPWFLLKKTFLQGCSPYQITTASAFPPQPYCYPHLKATLSMWVKQEGTREDRVASKITPPPSGFQPVLSILEVQVPHLFLKLMLMTFSTPSPRAVISSKWMASAYAEGK